MMEQLDTEQGPPVPPPRPLGSSTSLPSVKTSEHTEIPEREIPIEPTEKKAGWRLFRRNKKGSLSSVNSRKSLLTIRRRRLKKKQGSENIVFPRIERDVNEQFISTQLLERKQRTKSMGSESRKSRMTNRVRSNSSYKTRPRRRGKKRLEQEEKERKKNLENQIKNLLDNLCAALVEKDRELFVTLFSEEKPQICHPVGILKENDVDSYFKHFVSVYGLLDPILAPGSVVLDLTNLSAHCELNVISKYADTDSSTKFEEPQHWHFDFEVIPSVLPAFEDFDILTKTPSRIKSSDVLEFNEGEPTFEVVIKRWHVYSSLSRYRKVTSRNFTDMWNSSKNWISLGRQYGVSYVSNQLVDAFSTEKTPPELTQFLQALNSYSPEALVKCFSPLVKAVVVEGLFSYYQTTEKNVRANVNEIVQIILKQMDKQRVQRIRCISVFRCGTRISARLALNVRREMMPAFLLLRMTGDKNNSSNNKVKEMLFCSPNT